MIVEADDPPRAERVIPTLQDAGFPWELALRLDETDLEHKADQEIASQQRIERAFVGMDNFTEADASRFKGRDDDAQALWRRVTAVPLTLLVGNSGVGKTSHMIVEVGTEDDLSWLAEWVIRYSLSEAGEAANSALIALDRRLYRPF